MQDSGTAFNALRLGAHFAKTKEAQRFDANIKATRSSSEKQDATANVVTAKTLPSALDFFGTAEKVTETIATKDVAEVLDSSEGSREKKKVKKAKKEKSEKKSKKRDKKDKKDKKRKRRDSTDNAEADPAKMTKEESLARLRKEYKINVSGSSDVPVPFRTFSSLTDVYKLNPAVQRNLVTCGYSVPTPIQMQAIPTMMEGRDLLACAPTGSGKTMAFLVPLLHALKSPGNVGFRGIVLCPTKELGRQIYNECERLAKGLRLKIHYLTKATASANSFGPQTNQKFDLLVSTPMRLVGMIQNSTIRLNSVEWLVMDEADKLWEMGFLEQVDEIIAACGSSKLKLALFSATLPAKVEEMARTILRNPVKLRIGPTNAATELIDQQLLFVGREDGKLLAIRQLIQQGLQPPCLVFVQSVERAKELFRELIYDGINVDVIHAERTQLQRENVIKKFRLGEIWVLIATNILGRGIDFKGVNLVVNYDFPQSTADYIHRIGRTGRAGRQGKAVTFFTNDDRPMLRTIGNVMLESGCEVPDWVMEIPKANKNQLRQLRAFPIKRKGITSMSAYDKEKTRNKRDAISHSKAVKKQKT
ncbi:hypothetical protein SARC_04507 [Sphaeroforma arctica JP610]|uniref:RNA helicase n=1 Tax=Sphaeroforma arctica JP610 TaxID=667725 RepID=A0A0L0G317_9EUKA|nr:hypothetical protein SARC_04507 [Sphaeroforma arctica JP610]KNC83226.1 hypothetical protein SARC_04507 [Sphaeroforma arctica JP610]|eukprot:XP_014157128.1 hypothetical protein SARC_04507 [Sphaeroforma arctica JP610]